MGPGGMFSELWGFYLSCLFALSLGDWMDVRGLVGGFIFVCCLGVLWG